MPGICFFSSRTYWATPSMGVLGVLDWLVHFPTPRCWKLGQVKQAVLIWFCQHIKHFITKDSVHCSGEGQGRGSICWGHFLVNPLFKGCLKIALGWECGLKVSNHFSISLCVRITFSSGDFRSFLIWFYKNNASCENRVYTLL